jgi:hypothetical protein
MVRMINEIKEDMYKHLSEFKEKTKNYLNSKKMQINS